MNRTYTLLFKDLMLATFDRFPDAVRAAVTFSQTCSASQHVEICTPDGAVVFKAQGSSIPASCYPDLPRLDSSSF